MTCSARKWRAACRPAELGLQNLFKENCMKFKAEFGSKIALFAALALGLAALPAAAADQALIDAAKKEGSVTWYTTQIIDQFARPAADAFEKKYGVKVNYVRADAAEGVLRIINESRAGHVEADLVDGTDTQGLIKEGDVLDYMPDSAKELPSQFVDPRHHWVATNLYVYAIGFNTDLVPKGTEPKSYEDLLDPKWKGKMTWSSRSSTTSAPGFIGIVTAAMGEEKAHAYLRELAKQNITPLTESARQVLDQVIAGEYSIALEIVNSHAAISAAKGAPVGWTQPQPSEAVFSVLSMTKAAPHPNAAKLLFDFLVGPDGQKLYRDADYIPVDPAVPPKDPSLRPGGDKFKAMYFSPEEVDDQLPAWTKVYNDLFR
jgi:iron(III) transport system substrate-binding protein